MKSFKITHSSGDNILIERPRVSHKIRLYFEDFVMNTIIPHYNLKSKWHIELKIAFYNWNEGTFKDNYYPSRTIFIKLCQSKKMIYF